MCFGLEITLKIGCTNNCDYCLQGLLLKNYPRGDKQEMDIRDFRKFIVRIPKNIAIHFSGFCEPLLHSRFNDFLNVVYKYGHYTVIYTTLLHADYDCLKHMRGKYNALWVHVFNPVAMHNRSLLTTWIQSAQDLRRLKMPANFVRVGDDPLPEEIETVLDDQDFVYRQPLITRSTIKTDVATKFRCEGERQNQGVLLPNGNIVLCCEDYGLKHVLGNLHKKNYAEIYQASAERRRVLEAMAGKKQSVLCARCNRRRDD